MLQYPDKAAKEQFDQNEEKDDLFLSIFSCPCKNMGKRVNFVMPRMNFSVFEITKTICLESASHFQEEFYNKRNRNNQGGLLNIP